MRPRWRVRVGSTTVWLVCNRPNRQGRAPVLFAAMSQYRPGHFTFRRNPFKAVKVARDGAIHEARVGVKQRGHYHLALRSLLFEVEDALDENDAVDDEVRGRLEGALNRARTAFFCPPGEDA